MNTDSLLRLLSKYSDRELQELIACFSAPDSKEAISQLFRAKMYERYPTANPIAVETLLLVFEELCDLLTLDEAMNKAIPFGKIMNNVLAKMTDSG